MINKVIIKPEKDAGLSNRIKCVVNAMHIANINHAMLFIDWKPSFSCGAKYEDIFENKIESINNIGCYYKENDIIKEINTWEFPDISKEQILEYLNSLIIKKEIMEKVNEFDLKNAVGIHCRRNEFRLNNEKNKSTNELFFKKMDKIIAKNKDVHFFLATDSKKTEEEFYDKYVWRIITYPKLNLDRERSDTIIEAMIELILLSKCNTILGSYLSTYSEMAYWLGNCKAKYEEIGKPDIQQYSKDKRTSISSFINQYLRRNSSLYRKIMRVMGYWG